LSLVELHIVQKGLAQAPRPWQRGSGGQLQLGNRPGINMLVRPLVRKRGLEKRIWVMYFC
jgi:hypothetical protein